MSDAASSDTAATVVHVFCDGSCLGNPGPGGWAALLVTHKGSERHEKMVSGGQPAPTTNNQMELMAAMRGLQALKRPCRVRVTSDSVYVIKGMKEWRKGWEARGMKNSQNKPVENLHLWVELFAAADVHSVEWHWVKGHAGHAENERVDEEARRRAEEFAR